MEAGGGGGSCCDCWSEIRPPLWSPEEAAGAEEALGARVVATVAADEAGGCEPAWFCVGPLTEGDEPA